VTASVRNLRAENVSYFRLQPDDVGIDFVATWRKKQTLAALKEELPAIRRKMRYLER